ncbi:Tripartite ATP-independent periplasmic transporters, DctQ component [Marinomonas gallaica]|uniref:TRAP transporter small permease protein n=1 Tax=Marinomonas gallaica TaxID=1806667 RepID=A0A1C3JRF5_9GAMM|nr:TRAP transporter small permease subunit [Marinomonas gallaica]SBT17752.1 Tripartite ATP-independent periplasmic transporters, DctQ component [Marinomonas gallaica]SBT20078.1 Tripartite ATP-independent periplasmic transporters, DctQ component [Marinomonas gallaica]
MSHSDSDALPTVPFATFLEKIVLGSGRLFAWSYVALIAVILLQVVLRYGFNHGMVLLEELQWHLYAIGVMFGVSYAQVTNSHIRVDLLHNTLSARARHLWEVFGIVFLLFPFIYVVFDTSLPFVYDSWRINETSASPTGLSYRWLIKSVIPLSFALLFLSSLARLIRTIAALRRG